MAPWAVRLSASKANLSRLRRYVPSALASLGVEPGLAHGVLTLLANLALEKRNQVPLMTVVPTLLGVLGESPPSPPVCYVLCPTWRIASSILLCPVLHPT